MTAYALQDIFFQKSEYRASQFFRFFLIAAFVLVATAPIYWLPGFPLPVLTAIKTAAFVSAVGLAFLVTGARFIQLGTAFPFIVAATSNFIAFLINGSTEYGAYQAFIFLAPMAWVLALRSLNRGQASILLKYLPLSLALIALAAFYAFLAKFSLVPDLRPPLEGLHLTERQISAIQRAGVSVSGFNLTRTGWGTGTGMALILLGSMLIGRKRQGLGLLVLGLAVLAPAAMGGRGAALGGMAAFALAVITLRPLGSLRIWLVLGMAIIPVVAIDFLVSIGVLSERFFNTRSNADWFFVIDELTTGRLSTWVNAIGNFAKSPLYGVGVEESLTIRYTGQVVGVHNVWLGLLSEGGLMAFLPAAFIFLWCARILWRFFEFRALLVFVTVVSMVEPSVVFGTFGNQLPFWTAVGLAMRISRQ